MPPGTYSIVAFDSSTGECGVAVQSHWFAVGPLCVWARPGVGAVATQSVVEPAYGPGILDRLSAATALESALQEQLARDQLAALRQIGAVDTTGASVAYTGSDCIKFANHRTGPGFSCQANMMAHETVPAAMAAAFTSTRDEQLSDRLLQALLAAESAGGDVRGRQSAALVVVPVAGEPWRTTTDIRVDDHQNPLTELQRLLSLNNAYKLAESAENCLAAGHLEEAVNLYESALKIAPDSVELLFWTGLARAQAGDIEVGVRNVKAAICVHPGWADLLARLDSTIAPAARLVWRRVRESEK